MTIEEIITDKQLDHAWGSANFGTESKRDIIRFTLLKNACGYGSGSTARAIVKELGLITETKEELSRRGREYLYEAFRYGSNV